MVDSPINPKKSANLDENESVNLSTGKKDPTLSKPLEAILDYANKQDCFITASQIKAGVRLFRDTPVSEIRSYFQWLADKGHGVVRGDSENLEFSVR